MKRMRKPMTLLIGLICALQSAATTFIFAKYYSRKSAAALVLITLTVFNGICSAFCLLKFINENLPRKKLPKGVTYSDSEDDIFDFDIDALTDEELESMLK